MPVSQCRLCGRAFLCKPLLRYENMPKAAQFLPDADALANERGVALEVRQCSGCGLVQLSNDPVPYYREVIRAAAVSQEMRDFRAEQFARFLRDFSLQGKKVIEIGCGRGEYLSIMHQAGADAYGLEYSSDSVAECRAHGLNASQGYLETPDHKLEHAPFDAFFSLNYIEHLPNLGAALAAIAANLAENAIGLVEAPNFDMMIRDSLFSEFVRDHLFYFTRDTLAAALRLHGFDILTCEAIWHDYILAAVVRKRKKLDVSHFHTRQAKLKADVHAYVARFGSKKVAIWGAGHQAFAVMSLLGLADKIRYVVDSAPFKQGKFTPATHIPIVAPDALASDPVDAVIVMAGSYSDEVAGIVRQKFSNVTHVAVLRHSGVEERPPTT